MCVSGRVLAVALAGALAVVSRGQSCLIISEVVDGTVADGNPKFVEITNTDPVNDYTFPGGGVIIQANNSNDRVVDLDLVNFTIPAGDSFVIASSRNNGAAIFEATYGFAADLYLPDTFGNGDDRYILTDTDNGAHILDIYGELDTDGSGTDWEYTDSYAYRLPTCNVAMPTFDISQWYVAGVDALDGEDAEGHAALTTPGMHAYAVCEAEVITGACCVETECLAEMTVLDCHDLLGIFMGAGTDCAPNPCDDPVWACCANDICFMQTEANCLGEGGIWFEYWTCDDMPCDLPGSCVIITEVVDGCRADGSPKFVELTNTGTFDYTFLHGGIIVQSNASDDRYIDIDLGGVTIASGQSFVVAASSQDGISLFLDTYGFHADLYDGSAFGNGNDRYILTDTLDGSHVLDIYGEMDVDGTDTDWEYTDSYAWRRPQFNSGNGGMFAVGEWSVAEPDYLCGEDDEESRLLLQTLTTPGAHNYYEICGAVVGEGACCLPGGFCVIRTVEDCDVEGGLHQGPGVMCYEELCPGTPGACCLADGLCVECSWGDCVDYLGGEFYGEGTTCNGTDCPPPTGACCLEGYCYQIPETDCTALGGGYMGDFTDCDEDYYCSQPVAAGDIALGLSHGHLRKTLLQIREAEHVGGWAAVPYLQSVEFDNTGGALHNGAGNLLALDFGAPPDPEDPEAGGILYNLATDGSNHTELLYRWNTGVNPPGVRDSRVTGLSISPTNEYIAVYCIDFDDVNYEHFPELCVLAYDAGPEPGSGSGAAITGAWLFDAFTEMQNLGTAWYDGDTVLLYAIPPGSTGQTELCTVDFDGVGGFVKTVRTYIPVGTEPSAAFTSVAYRPDIAPYVFCLFSNFDEGVSVTKLMAVDPATWELAKQIDVSLSCETGRELAIGADGYLYISQYAGGGAPTPRVYVDRINTSYVEVWYDNLTSDYFAWPNDFGPISSYNGLDVAFGEVEGLCAGDMNCDGVVGFDDIALFVGALAGEEEWGDPDCAWLHGDCDGDGDVDFEDIAPFIGRLGAVCG